MNLRGLRRHWDAFGRRDPLWAILTDPDKTDNRWDTEEFYRTGRDEAAAVMAYLHSLGLAVSRRRALDFGCGVGRVTHALADHFDEVVGVDIAPSMIELARRHVRSAKCRFVLNESDRLAGLEDGSFSLVYSNIVLQHMAPRYARRYLTELLRVLEPGGCLLFQLPSEAVPEVVRGVKAAVPRVVRDAWRAVRRWREFPRMEGHAMERDAVVALLAAAGGRLVDVRPDGSAGPTWRGFRYCVTKDG